MLQRLSTLALLASVILWIILSYIPDTLLPLPTVAFTGSGKWLAGLAVAALILFVAIQALLVRATAGGVRHHQAMEQPSFRLRLGAELFWTALPLVMTLVLAWAGYARWQQLTLP